MKKPDDQSKLDRRQILRGSLGAGLALATHGCFVGRAATKNFSHLLDTPKATPKPDPHIEGARLGITWIGHASMLVQLGPHFVLTDPMLMPTIAQLAKRMRDPGIDPKAIPPLDAVVISHMHQDHYSPSSLDLVEEKIHRLLLPENGLLYAPDAPYRVRDMGTWQEDLGGAVKVTQVPVKHSGWRYAIDAGWMQHGFCGWVLQYGGVTVYFGGDTGYDRARFVAAKKRFPKIDLALLPIAPVEPRELHAPVHIGPREALDAFVDLGADVMIPMHYDTFWFGDDQPGDALKVLEAARIEKGIAQDRVRIAEVGVPLRLL